jgi:menaquinone-9 beta-reductase
LKTSHKIYDVVVVGAGPSGSAAAGILSSAGHSVLMIDRKNFPREKVCGDGLTGDSLRMLKRFDIWDEVRLKAFKSDKIELFPFERKSFTLNTPIFTIKRSILDNVIKRRAVRSGADFKVAKFTGSIFDNDGVYELEVWDYEFDEYRIFKGRIIIFAMGCQSGSFVSEYFFKDSKVKPEIIALRGYCKADWQIEHPVVFFNKKFPNGYVWIFPMGDDVYNVGCGTRIGYINIRNDLYDFLSKNRLTKNVEIKWITKPKGAFIKTDLCNLTTSIKGNVLLTGETLGSTYPFTGEGIGKALETGYLTAQLVSRALYENNMDILKTYPEFMRNELESAYRPYRAAESLFSKKRTSKLLYKFLCKSKTLSDCVADILSENKRPENIKLLRIMYRILRRFVKF